MDRHQTWTKIGEDRRRPSPLQNQFALAEYARSEAEALAHLSRNLILPLKQRQLPVFGGWHRHIKQGELTCGFGLASAAFGCPLKATGNVA